MAHKYSVDNYHWLGFDLGIDGLGFHQSHLSLDHTVVRYKLDAHHKLIHDCIWRYLVEMAGYPEALRKACTLPVIPPYAINLFKININFLA